MDSPQTQLSDVSEACTTFHIVYNLIEETLVKIAIFLVQCLHPAQIVIIFNHFLHIFWSGLEDPLFLHRQ